jgi:hypothetical protein
LTFRAFVPGATTLSESHLAWLIIILVSLKVEFSFEALQSFDRCLPCRTWDVT